MAEHSPDDSASRRPAVGDAAPRPEVPYKEYRARLDKRDHLLADPNAAQRHHTVMLVKKTELAPGEVAALGRRRGWGSLLTLAVVVLVVAGSVALVYSPWLSPPPLKPPTPPEDPALIPPDERPVVLVAPPTPPKPPAFAARNWVFTGPEALTDLNTALRPQGIWTMTAGGLTAPPQADLLVSWLKGSFDSDLALELELAVAALPGRPDATAREFQIVFGDGATDRGGLHFRVPSLAGENHADAFDEVGNEVASYGHNHYGWPFETGRFYRLKVLRKDGLLTISRDGEVICSAHQPAGDIRHIGVIPVTGVTVHWIRIEAR